MASRSWNRVELIGNLTRDPEMRYTPSGAAVVTFTIATNRTFVSDGEKKEEADFHRCVAWNKLAELCSQLLKKGNKVFVSGRLQNRSWETPEGQTRYITEIVIEDMIVLTQKSGGELDEMPPRKLEVGSEKLEEKKEAKKEEQKEKAEKAKPEKEEIENLDDLPF